MRFQEKRCVVAGSGEVADAVAARLASEGGSVTRALEEGVDVLVTAFEWREDRPFLELDDELWEWTLDENLKSAFLAGREAARRMAEAGGGVIVHVGSDVAVWPGPGTAAYAAAKVGVHLLATAMALDLVPHGVRVCCVAGSDAEDVAAAVAFCASDEASYVLGSTFFLDGPIPYRG
jgi:NAD(P)-dependent dehydrogenase (short-subunit alcohol dehydrogenase family)